MAGAFSKIEGDAAAEYMLLRSIHYRQAIPQSALGLVGATRLSEILSWMMGTGLILRRSDRYELTELGEGRLASLAGAGVGRIPLIDHDSRALYPVKRVGTVRIEASTAREIAKRVSGGDSPKGTLPGR